MYLFHISDNGQNYLNLTSLSYDEVTNESPSIVTFTPLDKSNYRFILSVYLFSTVLYVQIQRGNCVAII